MTYEYLRNIQQNDRSVRLLNSDNFPMVLSFLHDAFVQRRNVTLRHSEILNYLDDYLYTLRQSYPDRFPKEAKAYLDDFASERSGYLRKYYGSDDEPLYELTPPTQKAMEFLESLNKQEFVGTRSKFGLILELLEELTFETTMSDEERIADLRAQKEKIDQKIEAIEQKRDIRFDSSRIKEQYMQIEEIARKLKYDFSQIEYNFRELNTLAMEQIATRADARGEVLGSIFDIEERIRQQDQGKSFFAFWQLLTDPQKSAQLGEMIESLYTLEPVRQIDPEQKLKSLKFDLLKRGEKISTVTAKLMEQLRRFLDDRVWADNRRILDLAKSIEQHALEVKSAPPTARGFMKMEGEGVPIGSTFSKRLFVPKKKQVFDNTVVHEEIEVDMESFYDLFFVDEELLQRQIEQLLLRQLQCTIVEVCELFPPQKGAAELVGYLSIAKRTDSIIEPEHKVEILISAQHKVVRMPNIIFAKGSER